MVSRIERVVSGKRDDISERQSLVFIQYNSNYSGTAKETEKTLGLARGLLQWLGGKSQFPRGSMGKFPKGYRRLGKLLESVRLEFVESEHCIPVFATEFKLSEATSGNALWLRTQSGA